MALCTSLLSFVSSCYITLLLSRQRELWSSLALLCYTVKACNVFSIFRLKLLGEGGRGLKKYILRNFANK